MKLGLGTVQFGLDYGVSNRAGRPEEAAVGEVLRLAAEHGIRVLDTAPSYGDSEARIGRLRPRGIEFEIVTKTPPYGAEDSAERCAESIATSARRSLERLGASSLAGLLEHRPAALLDARGDALFGALLGLRDEGLVAHVGASGYDGRQLLEIAERYPIDLVQLPVNALDRRALESGVLAQLRRRGVAVHARSVFLQGALLLRPEALPRRLQALRGPLQAFRRAARDCELSPLEAALGFVLGLEEVDIVLCGVQRPEELAQVLEASERSAPRARELRERLRQSEPADPHWLDPSHWDSTR